LAAGQSIGSGLVVHKAYVDVNEEGAEATAATAVVEEIRSGHARPVFRTDHPFVFLIRDTRNGSVLFLGRVVNPDGPLGHVEEAGEVHRQDAREVGLGVLRERLGDEYPCVVDQHIDPAEPLDRAADDLVGDCRVGDVAGDCQHVRRGVGLDRPGVGDDPIAAVEESPDQAGPDPLRRPRDDGDLTLGAHDEPPFGISCDVTCRRMLSGRTTLRAGLQSLWHWSPAFP
jgi:hypothetical protein